MPRFNVTRVLFPIQTLTVGSPVASPAVNVPNNLNAVMLIVTTNEPAGFMDPAERIGLTIECSLDGGATWRLEAGMECTGGAFSRGGDRPNLLVTLPARNGPIRQARATLQAVSGAPTVGVNGDVVDWNPGG